MAVEQMYPNDKSTVFSIAPFGGAEFKPGLYPGSFIIPPCNNDKEPARLVVGASHHLVHIAGRKQPLRVITPSYEVAKSIVNDYLDGQLFTAEGAHPGICWLQGDITLAEFRMKHAVKLTEMQEVQRRWFVLVVKKTQDEWNKHKNSRVVSDQARFAVRALDLEIPEWMRVDEMGTAPDKCPACGVVVSHDIAWCPNCIQGGIKVIINEEVAKKLKLGA